MTNKTPALAAALLAATIFGAPAAAAIESSIDGVTVYARGADVTRLARVSLEPGANVVTLEGLPGNIDLGRASAAVADPRVELRSIRLDVREERDAYDAEVRRLEAAIAEVNDTIEAIDDGIAAADLQLKFLEGLSQEYAGRERSGAAAGQADVASWQQAMDSIGAGASGALEKKRAGRKARREAEKDLSALQRELEDKRGRRADSAVLLITLESPAALATELRVTYFQWRAGWRSSYAAHLDSDASELRLTHEAEVGQTTSEGWQDVELTLSTGNPGGGMQAPGQDSEFLDLNEPTFMERAADALGRQGLRLPEGLALEEVAVSAAMVQSPTRYAAVYRAPGRADIDNSADREQAIPLAEHRFGVALVTRATPRQEARAYLTARFALDSETPLFGGPMRVFVDGAYAGLADIPDLLPGAEVVLPMGVDRQVEVLAIDQGGEKASEGFISTRNTELTDYLIEIVNRHSRASAVEVIDYYPVPRDERIQVSVPRSATPPDERDLNDRPGVLAWRKDLAPGERWRIAHQYEVSYPKDTELSISPD